MESENTYREISMHQLTSSELHNVDPNTRVALVALDKNWRNTAEQTIQRIDHHHQTVEHWFKETNKNVENVRDDINGLADSVRELVQQRNRIKWMAVGWSALATTLAGAYAAFSDKIKLYF